MKKIAPIVLCFLLAITASAQKIRFTNSENQWQTYNTTGDGCTFECNLSYGTDTFAYSHTYKRIDILNQQTSSCQTPEYGIEKPMWIREDTIANIVYYRYAPEYGVSMNDTTEHILYNYNLQMGDTIQYANAEYSDSVVDSVVYIDSTMINGIYHKIFTMNGIKNTIRAYTLIEGIGSTIDPEFPAVFQLCFEGAEKLSCFTQGAFSPDITTPYYMCFGEVDTFRNCQGLSVNNLPKQPASLTISPNPASNQLTVTADHISTVTIFNLLGQVTYNNNFNTNQAQIDVSTLFPGIYFVKVNGTEVKRFLKE